MDLQLGGKTALVTGSTKGIGLAIAASLAQEGASVIVNGRTSDAVNEAIAAIKKQTGATVKGIAADGGSASGIKTIIEQSGDIDILVNNLGVYEVREFADITDEDWSRIFDINVMSGIRLSRHYLPLMIKKNWGRVVFISSESAVNIPTEMIHYGFSKTAQIAIARGLSQLTVGTNVTVNSVLVGPTRSEGVEQFIKSVAKQKNVSEKQVEADFFKDVRPTSLLKRFETTQEVADMVAFICSQRASVTNGAALRAEGGCVTSIL